MTQNRGYAGKRCFDVVVGTLLAIVSLPVILILAACSAARFGACPIFVQERVGFHGRRFRIWKIRSLPTSTPGSVDKYELQNVHIPRLGAFMRSTHLDELPQFMQVVLGDLSLVGPRPAIPELVEHFTPAFTELRTSVRPGCSGLWQVTPSGSKPMYEDPEPDERYVQCMSLRLDVWILFRTVLMCTSGSVVELDDVPSWVVSRRAEFSDTTGETTGDAVDRAGMATASPGPSGTPRGGVADFVRTP
jgi:lipopolysaccharide/colanic/teichoic acid biosynthesis glycosyltransferase